MTTTHNNYYDILGINTDANLQTIKDALDNLRRKDSSSSFSATLNRIESILVDPKKRASYDAHIKQDGDGVSIQAQRKPAGEDSHFVDLGEEAFMTANDRQIRQVELSAQEHDDGSLEPADYPIDTVKLAKVAITAVLLAVLCVGAYAGFVRWQIHEQTISAITQLERAQEEVEQYIRKNGYFPATLSAMHQETVYDLRLEQEKIILTFNHNAAKPIRGGELFVQAKHLPRLGLSWECRSSANFKEKYLPTRCY